MRQFCERTYRDRLGDLVIQSRLRPSVGRRGYERQFFRGIEFGLAGWQRAHSQGGGTGSESAEGIRFAPEAVNQAYQNHGIERFLRELVTEYNGQAELWLTTVTSTHAGTLRLKEIHYEVNVVRDGQDRCLFAAGIEVSNDIQSPRVTINGTPYAIGEIRTPSPRDKKQPT